MENVTSINNNYFNLKIKKIILVDVMTEFPTE